jgi:hypothetical protein
MVIVLAAEQCKHVLGILAIPCCVFHAVFPLLSL